MLRETPGPLDFLLFTMLSALIMAFLLGSLDVTDAQKLPENDDDSFIFDIPADVVFYDTKVLPEAKEVSVFLPRNETKRFFYVTDSSTKKSVYFAVTPCSSAVEWRIYFRYQSFSSEGRRLDDPLSQQRDLLRRPKRSKRLLQTLSGHDMMSYLSSREFRSGLFILELLAKDHHTTALLYATATPDAELAYPEVPSSSVIEVIQADSNAVTVAWKPSPSELRWSQPIEYCLAHNTRRNYRTLCALQADLHGEVLPQVPSYAGFGFQWEKSNTKHSSRLRKTILSNYPAHRDIRLACVGRRNWYTFVGLFPGTQYFVDVFAISPLSNRTSTYTGTSFITEGPGEAVTLPERRVLFVPLRHKRGTTATFEYSLESRAQRLVFSILPCFGQVNIEIRRDSQLVASASQVRHLRKLMLTQQNSSSRYLVHVTGDSKQSQNIKILATRRPNKDPFPDIPEDPRLQVTDQSITCNSVELRWLAPDEKALYCLYRRKESNSFKGLFAKQDWCSPQDTSKKDEKLFCRKYRHLAKQRSGLLIRETIHQLRPHTNYVFELQLSKRKGETLSYEQVRVTTRAKC